VGVMAKPPPAGGRSRDGEAGPKEGLFLGTQDPSRGSLRESDLSPAGRGNNYS
jgi:hypothetical protein